jgi:hypothetical protein
MQDEGHKGDKPNKREAFFASFAARAKTAVTEAARATGTKPLAIMLTGGLRSRIGMATAIEEDVTDLVGLGRPAAIRPRLPLTLTDASIADEAARCPPYTVRGADVYRRLVPIKVAAAGFSFIWHACALHEVAGSKQPDLHRGFLAALLQTIVPALMSVLLAPLLSLGAIAAAAALYKRS